jgi:hypothetical protein
LLHVVQGAMRELRGSRMTDDVREQVLLQRVMTGPGLHEDSVEFKIHHARRANRFEPTTGVAAMTVHLALGPLVSLIAGILILIMPRLLNFIVAIYLIVIGLIGLFGMGSTHF